jgi:phage major head subunit gpT-like protein
MEITPQSLGPLFVTYEMSWQRGFQAPPSYYADICTPAPSGSRSNTYAWLGRTTKFREWIGPRAIEMLEAHGYSIANKHYENTIGVSRNDIEDDQYGIYTPVFEQMGWDAKVHPDQLAFALIKSALSNIDSGNGADRTCYDGATFFSTAHPVGLAGATTSVSNCSVTRGNLATYPPWILIDAGRPIRPFIWQTRKPYTMTRMNALTDEAVFMENEFRFGVDARVNAGFGLWQLAYASDADLSNPANFAAAIAKMKKFTTDAGLPFGSFSSSKKYLLVGPDLETHARRLLNAELIVGQGVGGFQGTAGTAGATSGVAEPYIWKGTCELIVSEYLVF